MVLRRKARWRTCRLFHAWSVWGPLEFGRRKSDGRDVGVLVYQQRKCERCGKVEFRTVAG